MTTEPSPEQTLELLKVLAQPVRIKIVRELALGRPMRVSDVATAIGEPANSVSYHLRQLAKVGIARKAEPATGGDARETWWEIRDWQGLRIDPASLRDLPGGLAALSAMNSIYADESAVFFSSEHIEAAEASDWPLLQADGPLELSRDEAKELVQRVADLIDDASQSARRHVADSDGTSVHRYEFRIGILPEPGAD